MDRRSSRLLPFGDKNAMLVIVFLVLSLGIGSLRSDQETTPVSSLHPSLVTIRQTTQGYLGVEKLVYLAVDDLYFVDQPISRPKGLDEHSTSDQDSFPDEQRVRADNPIPILDATLSPGSIFHSAGARRESTAVASWYVIDDEHLMARCLEVLQSNAPAVSVGGQCQPIEEVLGDGTIWRQVEAIAGFFPGEPGRCVGNTCNVAQGGADISFSGVNGDPWNGAAISFNERSAFKRKRNVTGLACALEPSGQTRLLGELNSYFSSNDHLIVVGNRSFRLFDRNQGLPYYEKRLLGNAETSLEISIFDPNQNDSVNQLELKFNGLQGRDSLPDGVVFKDLESCEETNGFLKNNDATAFSSRPASYPWEITRLFKFDLVSGNLENIFGVDEIARR